MLVSYSKMETHTNTQKTIDGRKNRRKGAEFETKVRKDLESEGWIVDKFNSKWNGERYAPAKYNKFRWGTTGFPDFIVIKPLLTGHYKVRFIECKYSGVLSKAEKEILQIMVSQGLECFVASKKGNSIWYEEIMLQKASKEV